MSDTIFFWREKNLLCPTICLLLKNVLMMGGVLPSSEIFNQRKLKLIVVLVVGYFLSIYFHQSQHDGSTHTRLGWYSSKFHFIFYFLFEVTWILVNYLVNAIFQITKSTIRQSIYKVMKFCLVFDTNLSPLNALTQTFNVYRAGTGINQFQNYLLPCKLNIWLDCRRAKHVGHILAPYEGP